jgi:dihydrofolate reductase
LLGDRRRSGHRLSKITSGQKAVLDKNVCWMDSSDIYEKGITDDGADVIQSIECYVLGSRTYEHALQLGWPYGDTPTVVVTSRKLPSTRDSVEVLFRRSQDTGQ